MLPESRNVNFNIPIRVWVEIHQDDPDARDVIVEMEDGTIFTSLFITMNYLHRQMELTYDLSSQIPNTIPMRFAALDTSHIVVESLDRDAIEDVIDNLLAMDVFGCMFVQVTETPETKTSIPRNERTTQEVAAVVLSDVLVVEAGD